MTTFQPFEMERMMSQYEQGVEYNLSESGVHPILLRELLDEQPGSLDKLLETDINSQKLKTKDQKLMANSVFLG